MSEQTERFPHSDEPPSYNGAHSSHLSQPIIVGIERLSKSYKNVIALRNVSLIITQGEIFGLLGPNGAGKSTMLKLLLGFLHPDEGEITLFGSNNLSRARSRIGYLPERPSYHGNFTGREYLQFQARLSGYNGKGARQVAGQALEAVGLEEASGRRIKTYSKGMRQRLGLAVALLSAGGNPPDLLVLDEPSSGLAPEGQVAVRELILDCKRRGSTVLLCSHQLTEVERICSTVGVLKSGRLVAYTRLDGSSRVIISGMPREGAMEIAPHLIEYLKKLHPEVAVRGGQAEGEPLHVSLPTGQSVPRAAALKAAALRAMIDGRWDITSVHVENKDLETLYLQAIRPRAERAQGEKEQEQEQEVPRHITEPLTARLDAEPSSPDGMEATGMVSMEGDRPVPGPGEPQTAAWGGPVPTRPVSTGPAAGKPTTPLPALQPGSLPRLAEPEPEQITADAAREER